MKKSTPVLIVFVLVFIDQLVKHIIRTSYMDMEFTILPPFFYFVPKVNTNYSYVNLFSLGLGKGLHLILQIVILPVYVALFTFIRYILPHKKMMQGWLLFGVAGIVCVFIDTAFLGGSMDYVYLKPLYIFDLKDVYLNVGWIFFLYSYITLNKEDRIVMYTFKLRNFVKDRFRKKIIRYE